MRPMLPCAIEPRAPRIVVVADRQMTSDDLCSIGKPTELDSSSRLSRDMKRHPKMLTNQALTCWGSGRLGLPRWGGLYTG
jgi:hypothetical protein